MNKKTAWWLLGSGCVLVMGCLLITMWVRGDSAREPGTADPFGAVKEESPRERLNAISRSGRKASRPQAPLGAGWRELSIDNAVVHTVNDVPNWNCVYWGGYNIPGGIELKLGGFEWVIAFESPRSPLVKILSNAFERYVGMSIEKYAVSNHRVILRIGELEVRLLGVLELMARCVGKNVIVSEDAAGVVILPEEATVGEPFKPSNNRDVRTNRKMLARWFRDACQQQWRGHIPHVKAGSPFSIFSSTYCGIEHITDHHGYVEVQSLRIRGNRIVLKVVFSDPNVTRRGSRDWWLPLVEVPISDGLPVGRYSVQVDWEGEEEIQPGGSHIFTFEVVK